MTNSIVKFENQDIELITVDGQPMMTLSQIVSALGAASNQAAQLYTRHADEFTPEMTRIIKQGRTRVRVFNREGAWLIGMFARTPKAAAFRKWVITALAEHVDGAAANGQTALPLTARTEEETLARDLAALMLGGCASIKQRWFRELTAELEQARKTIKEQQETMQKISSFLSPTK